MVSRAEWSHERSGITSGLLPRGFRYELACGEPLWGDAEDLALLKLIAAHEPNTHKLPPGSDVHLQALLDALLTPDPAARAGAVALMDHSYFDEVEWPKLLSSELESPLVALAREQEVQRANELGEQDPLQGEPLGAVAKSQVDGHWLDGYDF